MFHPVETAFPSGMFDLFGCDGVGRALLVVQWA